MMVSPSCGQPLYIQRALGLGFSWAHAYGPLEPQTLLGSHLKTPSHVHGRCPERRSSSARCQGLDGSFQHAKLLMLVHDFESRHVNPLLLDTGSTPEMLPMCRRNWRRTSNPAFLMWELSLVFHSTLPHRRFQVQIRF